MNLLAHLNLNYLRIFLVVYRSKSMTQAAKELHMTQSGVSQQIKALEDSLDLILFDRVNRRIIPTRAAEILYRECSRHLENLENALAEITNQDKEITGRIKIGVALEADDHAITELCAQLIKEFPKIDLDLRSVMNKDLAEKLVAGHYDCGFMLDKPDERFFTSYPLANFRYNLFYRRKYSSPDAEPLPIQEEMRQSNFIGLPGDDRHLNRLIIENKQLSDIQIHELSQTLTTTSLHTLARLTASGLGFSLLPEKLDLISSLNLSPVPDLRPIERTGFFCHLEKRSFSVATEQLIKLCIKNDSPSMMPSEDNQLHS